jgi:site-specific DNA-methyltransferase (adenine-specific)
MIQLIKGDCLIESDKIESGSVDLILTDLPYGTVGGSMKDNTGKYKIINQSKWDNVIDSDKIMQIANRILRKNGKMILTAQQPFTTELISKAIPNLPHSYNMYWDKMHFANCLGANKAPVSYVEDVLIFSKKYDTERKHPLRDYFYNEFEKTKLSFLEINRDYLKCAYGSGGGVAYNMLSKTRTDFCMPTEKRYKQLQQTGFFNKDYSELKEIDSKYRSTFNLWEGNKFKSNILKYKKDYTGHHPTQKPILLLEDLIKTFSNEGDLVVDLTMGSGSTGVACKNTNRSFTGIEMDDNYFEIAQDRINNLK